MRHRFATPLLLLLPVLIVAAVGCSKDRNSTLTAPGQSAGLGTVHVRMTDAPADYDEVNIVVSEVQIRQAGCNGNAKSGGCWTTVSDVEATYDLLELRNGVFVTIALDQSVPAGSYEEIMLVLGEGSNVVVDGVTYPLRVPGGANRGVRIQGDFQVTEQGTVEVLLDFDAEQSIKKVGNGQYMLMPHITLVQGEAPSGGSIHGDLDPATAAAIDVLSGGSEVAGTTPDGEGGFSISSLPAGTYDVRIDVVAGYRDTTLTGVMVTSGQTTELGTITLSPDTTTSDSTAAMRAMAARRQ